MPKHPELTQIPPPGSARFEDRYPKVKDWLDGGVWELRPGQEFKGSPEAFYQTLKDYLKRNGLVDTVEIGQRGKSVWVKRVSRRSAPAPRTGPSKRSKRKKAPKRPAARKRS